MFDISELFSVIQIPAVSTRQVLLIYIYIGASVYWSLSVLCIFVCMFLKYIASSFWY